MGEHSWLGTLTYRVIYPIRSTALHTNNE